MKTFESLLGSYGTTWFARGCSVVWGVLFVVFGVWGISLASAQTISTGPSAFCHVTDGAFSDCNTNKLGLEEWSDIDFLPWAGANVYTDQRVPPLPALFLMYDLLNHHTPLGPTESFDIRFNVVENGHLEQYLVQAFGSGVVKIFVDGVEQTDPEGITAAVGGGLSPSGNGFFDVFVELEVPMNVVYSPDIPLFWSTAAPRPQGCQPGTSGCCPPDRPNCSPTGNTLAVVTTATVPISQSLVTAHADGTTTVTSVPFNSTPSDFCNRATGGGILGDLIDSLVPPTGHYSNHGQYMTMVVQKTKQAVGSLVFSHVLTAGQGQKVQSCIINKRAQNDVGKK